MGGTLLYQTNFQLYGASTSSWTYRVGTILSTHTFASESATYGVILYEI